MKESMITITDYMLLAKSVLVDDAPNIIKKREKILEKAKSYRENYKDKLKRNRKTVNSYRDDKESLYNQINTLTETMKSTTLVA